MNSFLKKIDVFGQKIELTYKSQSTFTTSIGGILTLFSGSGLLAFTVFSFLLMFHEETITLTSDKIWIDRNLAANRLNFRDLKFNMAFGIQEVKMDEGIGYWTMQYYESKRTYDTSSSSMNKMNEPVVTETHAGKTNMVDCHPNRQDWRNHNKEKYGSWTFDNFMCPNETQ